jgi:hypothetical protein
MLNFYMFYPSLPPAILSFFLFLSMPGSRKTLENKRWVDPSLYSHKTPKGRVVQKCKDSNVAFLQNYAF